MWAGWSSVLRVTVIFGVADVEKPARRRIYLVSGLGGVASRLKFPTFVCGTRDVGCAVPSQRPTCMDRYWQGGFKMSAWYARHRLVQRWVSGPSLI